jgi:hypothetical protein
VRARRGARAAGTAQTAPIEYRRLVRAVGDVNYKLGYVMPDRDSEYDLSDDEKEERDELKDLPRPCW